MSRRAREKRMPGLLLLLPILSRLLVCDASAFDMGFHRRSQNEQHSVIQRDVSSTKLKPMHQRRDEVYCYPDKTRPAPGKPYEGKIMFIDARTDDYNAQASALVVDIPDCVAKDRDLAGLTLQMYSANPAGSPGAVRCQVFYIHSFDSNIEGAFTIQPSGFNDVDNPLGVSSLQDKDAFAPKIASFVKPDGDAPAKYRLECDACGSDTELGFSVPRFQGDTAPQSYLAFRCAIKILNSANPTLCWTMQDSGSAAVKGRALIAQECKPSKQERFDAGQIFNLMEHDMATGMPLVRRSL